MSFLAPLAGLSAATVLTVAGITTNEATSRILVVVGGVLGAPGAAAGWQKSNSVGEKNNSLEEEVKRQRDSAVSVRQRADSLEEEIQWQRDSAAAALQKSNRLEEEIKRQRQVAEKAEKDAKALKNKVKIIEEEGQLLAAISRYLCGMAKLHKKLSPILTTTTDTCTTTPTFVFQAKSLKCIYIEPFHPGNLNTWEPKLETDVYLIFGVLQDFTGYQYCCGSSTDLLRELGANYSDTAKPDAILVDRTTRNYVMAEWKPYSSQFKSNHKPEDVDVLVCWKDNETDRKALPPKVLALHAIAKTAAETAMSSKALMEDLFSQLGVKRDRVDLSLFSSPIAQRFLWTLFGPIPAKINLY